MGKNVCAIIDVHIHEHAHHCVIAVVGPSLWNNLPPAKLCKILIMLSFITCRCLNTLLCPRNSLAEGASH